MSGAAAVERAGDRITLSTSLRITVAVCDHDRVLPLVAGSVHVDGADARVITLPIEDIISQMLSEDAFDVAEMSLASALMVHERQPSRWCLLPVFPSRMFRHSAVFINSRKGIDHPQDLAGRRVGTPLFARLTAGVWIRGILEDDFGLSPRTISWVLQEACPPGSESGIPVDPTGWTFESVSWETNLEELLVAGEIDALISARVPAAFLAGDARIRRLFPDFIEAEQEYFGRSGIFPPMHVLVTRGDLYRRHPWIGPSLFMAFAEAKRFARRLNADIDISRHSLAWWTYYSEAESAILGPDPWSYGVEANRRPLETFTAYCQREGLLRDPHPVPSLFPENVLKLTDGER